MINRPWRIYISLKRKCLYKIDSDAPCTFGEPGGKHWQHRIRGREYYWLRQNDNTRLLIFYVVSLLTKKRRLVDDEMVVMLLLLLNQ